MKRSDGYHEYVLKLFSTNLERDIFYPYFIAKVRKYLRRQKWLEGCD